MPYFAWGAAYLTGLKTVDEQHHALVDLINDLGRHIADNDLCAADQDALFAELVAYAQRHFTEEEAMMRGIGLDERHVRQHREAHAYFLHEITAMQQQRADNDVEAAGELMAFLTHWLSYHILGMDRNMAVQAHDIERGLSPGEAFDHLEERNLESTGPLLTALNGLFGLVSSRNQALAALNADLERKVAERTQELAELNRHLEELAMTDALTGLPNRRQAMRRLVTLWEEAVDSHAPLACLMIDADHFKGINDTYGHEAGDVVLTTLAQTLRNAVRNDDIVCRLGGDEFFVICPATDAPGIARVAQMILDKVGRLRVPTGQGHWQGSVSIGSAVRHHAMQSHEDLIRWADEAVYAAKRAGRNCHRSRDDVTLAQSTPAV